MNEYIQTIVLGTQAAYANTLQITSTPANIHSHKHGYGFWRELNASWLLTY